MRNFQQTGNVLTLTAPSGGVVSGGSYQIGNLFVVAAGDAAVGESFEGQRVGVFTLVKDTGSAWVEGERLYWDDTAKKVTTTELGNMRIGWAAEAALMAATTGIVVLGDSDDPEGTDSLADGSVTTAKLADLAVTTAKLAADAVDGTKLADDAVASEHIADGAVVTAAIGDDAVTAAKAHVFFSAEITGDGTAQSTPHGLGVVPTEVFPTVTEDPTGTGFDIEPGAHDATNVIYTVTTGVKYRFQAWG